jgi:hypothetical protein
MRNVMCLNTLLSMKGRFFIKARNMINYCQHQQKYFVEWYAKLRRLLRTQKELFFYGFYEQDTDACTEKDWLMLKIWKKQLPFT